MNLVDTDVIVDCLRGTIPAQEWLKQLGKEPFAVPAVAARFGGDARMAVGLTSGDLLGVTVA